MFSLPCSFSKWPLLNLFLLPATFFMASCHFLKILYQPHRMELTLTDFTHFGTEINTLCMQIVPMRLPTSVEGIVINCSHYSTWIIIIAPYLALPHKPKRQRHCLPLLHKPPEIVMKQSICCVLFQLQHSRSWAVYFIHCKNNATKRLCTNDTSLHHITVQSWNLVCIA